MDIAEFCKQVSYAGLKSHLKTPLFINAYFLIANTAFIALLGFVFWFVTARFYSVEVVGLGTAVVAAIALLSGISDLGLGFGLIRFLPSAGKQEQDMINSCLTLSVIAALISSGVYILFINFFNPGGGFSFIRENPVLILAFMGFTVLTTVFSLVNYIFIAKRQARYVLIKNICWSIFRIPLIAIFAVLFAAFGIVAANGMAVAIALLLSLFWLLTRAIKGYSPRPKLSRRILFHEIIPFSIGNYIANLCWLSPNWLFPLIVVNVLGQEPNAYFYMTWNFAIVLFVIPDAASTSLFAEGSHYEDGLNYNTKRAISLTFLLLIPAIIIFYFAGHWFLALYNTDYAENGQMLLKILALSAIPLAVNNFYLNICKVKKRLKNILLVSIAIFGISLGLSSTFLAHYGLPGVGYSWLTGHSIVAFLILAVYLVKRVRLRGSNKTSTDKDLTVIQQPAVTKMLQ